MAEQNDSEQGGHAADDDALSGLVEAYIDEQVKNAVKQQSEGRPKGKDWRKSWRAASPITKASLYVATAVAAANFAYVVVSCRTLSTMKQISRDSGQQTGQLIDAANQIKSAAWQFKGSAQGIDGNFGHAVDKLQLQADQVKRSADATKESLYISQRAYVDIFAPALDISKKSIILPITNTGHVPSGEVVVEAHGALFDPPSPSVHPDNYAVEWGWRRSHYSGIPNGTPVQLLVPFNKMDRNRLVAATEEVFVAGTITYADGFPHTAKTTKDFCWRSINSIIAQYIALSPCDAKAILPVLKRLDGYPQNEQQN